MNARICRIAAALCALAAGCSTKDGHAPAESTPTISLEATTSTVVANGTNGVDLTVTDTGGVAVQVTTDRGTFSGGGQSVQIPAGSSTTTGTVRLVACDSSANPGCVGTATVTATSTTGQATKAISFTSLASACAANCGADAGCRGLACTPTGGGSGTCSASAPSVCSSGAVANPDARLGGFAIPSPFATHPVMGVKSSGWNEFGGVSVEVLDDQGKPYPDGLVVRFEHRVLGGSTFGPPLATTGLGACAAPQCVAYDATTVDGVASAPLFAGTVAGTLVVTASANVGTETRSVTLPGIAVVGAKASGANFSIVCSPRSVPALAETNCTTSHVDAPITCAAILKDRFGNLLGTETQVIFESEAAAVGQVAWSPAYVPESQGADQKDLGTATQIFQTLGAGLPFDVPPLTAETSTSHALDGCGTRTHNPRDGVVTVIAIADGEEAFFDANGNGVWDGSDALATPPRAGEPFVDLGEPFVDQDDDGAWVSGERFLDLNGNGAYDGPNGRWDARTKIWTQTNVVYTGAPATLAVPGGGGSPVRFLGTRWIDDVTPFASACTATPAPRPFSVASAISGTPPTPATKTTYFVVASDMNLNVLDTASSYKVEVVVGKAKATYRGLQQYADEWGMFLRSWVCDQPPATTPPTAPFCSSECRAAIDPSGRPTAENRGPCVTRPSISDFWCGVHAPVVIAGGDTADVEPVEIHWLVDTPWENFLEGRTAHHVEPVFGFSDNDDATPPP